MLFLCIIGIIIGRFVTAEEIIDEEIKSEIESAVAESKALANDLANMLARMESRDDKSGILTKMSRHKLAMNKQMHTEQRISFPESDSLKNSTVSKAVQAMAYIIYKLSRSTGDSDESELTSSTIKQLQFVATKVEEVSSFYDVDSVDELIDLLKSISDQIELKFEKTENKVLKMNRKEEPVKGTEHAAVDKILQTLEKVSKGLEAMNIQKVVKARHKSSLAKFLNEKKTVQPRIPIDLTDKEPTANCRKITAANQVKVCVPKVSVADTPVNFLSGFVQEDEHCYDVSKTICRESSQIVSKEVCVYDYKQKTVVAPAQITEVTWERREEKFAVSSCQKKMIKDRFEDNEVEMCREIEEEFSFIIPAFVENVEDFVELNVPEPFKFCQVFKYEIPETICTDVTTQECSKIAHVETVPVTEYLDTVWMDYNLYQGSCHLQLLLQQIQVCAE